MRITRLVSGLVITGLAVATPVLVGASPASAATLSSTVTITPPTSTQLEYGDSLYLSEYHGSCCSATATWREYAAG